MDRVDQHLHSKTEPASVTGPSSELRWVALLLQLLSSQLRRGSIFRVMSGDEQPMFEMDMIKINTYLKMKHVLDTLHHPTGS